MSKEKLLIINPGSTSTKVAVYNEGKETWVESISHSLEELKGFNCVWNQLNMRTNLVLDLIKKHSDELEDFGAIVSRGGNVPPVSAGAYEVNDYMLEALEHFPQDQHASNVGAGIAKHIADQIGVKAYIYDALTVDEMLPINKITGLEGVERPARGHNLNTRAAAMKCCKNNNMDYEKSTLIVAHLGGGITVNLQKDGKIIDIIMDEEGPFSPERAGGMPIYAIVKMAYSGEYTREELMKQLQRKGGIISLLGTADMRVVEKMINEGNEKAKLIFDAMALAVAKNIGKIAVGVCGKVDKIILTGGIAYSKLFTQAISKNVEFIAPIEIIAGENEMDSLCQGILRVIRGEETAKLLEKK